jgi:hypothetical protein
VAAFSDELGAPVAGGGIGDFLQHEGRWGMVRCFFEERHGGSRPVLTETMAATLTANRGGSASSAHR